MSHTGMDHPTGLLGLGPGAPELGGAQDYGTPTKLPLKTADRQAHNATRCDINNKLKDKIKSELSTMHFQILHFVFNILDKIANFTLVCPVVRYSCMSLDLVNRSEPC